MPAESASTPIKERPMATHNTDLSESPRRNLFSQRKSPFKSPSGKATSSTPIKGGPMATHPTVLSKSPRRNLFSPRKSPFKSASGKTTSSTPINKGPMATHRRVLSESPRRHMFSPRKSPFKSASERNISILPIMREISDLKSLINKVIIMATKMWTVLAPPMEGPSSSPDFPRLPVDSKDDMKKWDAFLSEERNFYSAVNLLSSHGRSDHRESIYAMLMTLLSDKIASGFNLDGRRKKDDPSPKAAFGDTLSYKLLKVAMKKHINQFNKGIDPAKVSLVYNIKNIKEDTMRWLKDAKTRANNKDKREKAAKDKAASDPAEYVNLSQDLFDDSD